MSTRQTALINQPAVSTDNPPLAESQRSAEGFSNYLMASAMVVATTFAFMLAGPKEMVHWFVLPAMACGILMGADVVRWLRGSLDPFDPKGLIGLVIFYGFFIAPILHVYWNIYSFDYSGDPRHWLGVVAAINTMGLIFYKISQRYFFNHTTPVHTKWRIIPSRLLPVLTLAALIGVSAQFYFYFFVLRQVARISDPNLAIQALKGYGWLLLLGDPLLILFLTAFICLTLAPKRKRNWLLIALILSLAGLSQLIWVGLRGSRGATVAGVFWVTGLIHRYWRRLRSVHLLLGLTCLVAFMYFYGFYKSAGWRALSVLGSGGSVEWLERRTGRTFYGLLLGDLARADVQARIANEVTKGKNDYHLRYGLTYLDALSKLIPQSFWLLVHDDLSFKAAWGKGKAFVDLNEGKGKFHPIYHTSSRVYGLSGEAMLNFGLAGVPLAWMIFGLFVGWLRRKSATLAPDDTRWPLALFFAYIATLTTVSDLDNMIFTIFKAGFLIFLCIFLWSGRGEFKESP